jgi:ATP-dependent RNA circularization protein (DNA/RNA ligase family)
MANIASPYTYIQLNLPYMKIMDFPVLILTKLTNALQQRFSNFFQVGTTFIIQNVLRITFIKSECSTDHPTFKCSEHMLIPAHLYF